MGYAITVVWINFFAICNSNVQMEDILNAVEMND